MGWAWRPLVAPLATAFAKPQTVPPDAWDQISSVPVNALCGSMPSGDGQECPSYTRGLMAGFGKGQCFDDEVAHFSVGGFEVGAEAETFQGFGGGGADAADDALAGGGEPGVLES